MAPSESRRLPRRARRSLTGVTVARAQPGRADITRITRCVTVGGRRDVTVIPKWESESRSVSSGESESYPVRQSTAG